MSDRLTRALRVAFVALAGVISATTASSAPADEEGAAPSARPLPKQDLTPQILYQFLLAEIAGHRGNLPLSSSAYLDLAKSTRDPRIARRAAEVAFFSRQLGPALEAAKLWVELEPDSTQARQTLAGLLVAANRTEDLAGQLGRMLAAEQDKGAALVLLNRTLARHPDKKVVQQIVFQVTEPYLGLAEAHFARSVAAQAAGDLAAAQEPADRALALRPDWEHAVLNKVRLVSDDPPKALALLRDYLARNPAAREARLAYARLLVADKRYDEARQEFRGLLADHGDKADVVYAVGVLSLQLRDLPEAEKQFRRLLELGPTDPEPVRFYLGQIAEEGKRWDEALSWYGAVAGGEQLPAARARAAGILAKQGKLEEGRRLLRDYAAGQPDEKVRAVIAEAQLLRDAGRHAEAYGILEQELAGQPDQPELLYEAALYAEKLGRNDVLERNLRRLIELRPDNAHAYNALGYSFADRNLRLDEAQQLIEKALTLMPEDPFILDSKGWVLFRRGDRQGALDVLNRAFGMRQDPEIAAHLGEVLWSLGRRDEALRTWAESQKSNPTNEVLSATIKRFRP